MKLFVRFLLFFCLLLLTGTQYLGFRTNQEACASSQKNFELSQTEILALQSKQIPIIKKAPLGKKKKWRKATISVTESNEEDEDEDGDTNSTFKKHIKSFDFFTYASSVPTSSGSFPGNRFFAAQQLPHESSGKYLLFRVIRI